MAGTDPNVRVMALRAQLEDLPNFTPGASLATTEATARHMVRLATASSTIDRLDHLTVAFARVADAAKVRDDEVAVERLEPALDELARVAMAWAGVL